VALLAMTGGGCTIDSTFGSNVIRGTAGNDTICGSDGNDTIYGYGGNDTIYGGAGSDTIYAGPGADLLYGDAGYDRLYGEQDDDRIFGGLNDDSVAAGAGTDLVHGDGGNDRIRGEAGGDRIYADAGADVVWGDDGADLLYGGLDNDSVYGGPGDDYLWGDAGNDLLGGQGERDIMNGGANVDGCHGGAGFADVVHDRECERRSGAEQLIPWAPASAWCGRNDISCLGFAGYTGREFLGFPVCNMHNCTNYVAQRLYARGVRSLPSGNAYQWNDGGRRGSLVLVGASSPQAGDVAHWESLGGSANMACGRNCGHVAYVERVNYSNGRLVSITISESMWCEGGSVRTIGYGSSGWPTGFLR
jgi:Ca2+-binding RTX toxin-like protein